MAMDALGLPAEVERRLAEIGTADLLLGLVSYQHARTIPSVIRDLEKGVRARFPEARAVLLHADAGSTDGTVEAAAGAASEVPLVAVSHVGAGGPRATPSAHGVPGGAAALRTLCRIGRTLGTRALLLVGADLRALPEDWVERLLRPVWAGELDFVVPILPRHVLDGTLTTCLLYPLARALYGRALRHAMAAEAAFSAGLADRVCDAPSSAATRVASLYLTTTASASGARLGEAWLGSRSQELREGRLDLGDIMTEVVGAAFALTELYEDQWREARPGPAPQRLGEALPAPREAPPAQPARMVAVFHQGLRDLVPIWEQALQPDTLADLYPLGDLGPDELAFSPELWARVVYDFVVAYRLRTLHRDHLLQSLVPLYLGRLASLVREAAGQPASAQERLVERQAQAFERWKSDFADRWR